jgi:metal-responsive CopG/Arc/MetJ family transcriptional regulator
LVSCGGNILMNEEIEKIIKEISMKRAEILEGFARAYLANDKNLNPNNIELVEERNGFKTYFYFRERIE